MPVGLYFDHNVRKAVAVGPRLRGIDVITALEDGTHRSPDSALLDRATVLGRPLSTHDDDLLAEAAQRQGRSESFSGVIFVSQERIGIGQTVDELEVVARVADPDDLENQVVFPPL